MYRGNSNVENNFIIIKKIGKGAFGQVYKARNSRTNEDVAIKVERKSSGTKLLEEHECLKLLCGETGFSTINTFVESGDHSLLILELLGKNLEVLNQDYERKFSLKTIFSIGYQMIKRIKKLHCRHLIHRDLKPENFLIGNLKENEGTIYLVDFGLSKRFRNEKTGEHIAYKDNRPFIGNARFSSIYTHLGIEQSRRDDLISLSYIMLYFCKGSLPWQGIKCQTMEEKNSQVLMKKLSLSAEEIFSGAPSELLEFHNYCIALQFDEKPDYNYLKSLFLSVSKKENFVIEKNLEWKSNQLEYQIQELNTNPNTFSDEKDIFSRSRTDLFNDY